MIRDLTFVLLFFCSQLLRAQTPYENRHASIDVGQYHFAIAINDTSDIISGTATITFTCNEDLKQIHLDLLAPTPDNKLGMTVEMVEQQRSLLPFSQTADQLHISMNNLVKKGQSLTIKIKYSGIPADGLIISKNYHGDRTFFGDNWPNRARHWLPCVDHPLDKATVKWTIEAPNRYTVVANGKLLQRTKVDRGYNTTIFEETTPVPTKVMVFGAAEFKVKPLGDLISSNGNKIPVSAWAFPQDSSTIFYDYTEALPIVQYFDSLLGPFPFSQLANVQSKTIFGGMENAGCIFYNETTLFGEPSDRMTNLLAHEIGHQWFGNHCTEADYSDIWLSEGFATFLAAHYFERKYGIDKMRQEYIANRQKIKVFAGNNPRTPIVDRSHSDLMRLLNPNSYEKGAWFLNMLRFKIGEVAFWNSLRAYIVTYGGKNATTADFQRIVEKQSGQSQADFFKQWLLMPGLPKFQVQWKVKGQTVQVCILQDKDHLNAFPLELSFSNSDRLDQAGKVHTINVEARTKTEFTLTAPENARIWVDPRTVLLADWIIKTKK